MPKVSQSQRVNFTKYKIYHLLCFRFMKNIIPCFFLAGIKKMRTLIVTIKICDLQPTKAPIKIKSKQIEFSILTLGHFP